jgi:hypothetical protein
MRIELRDGQWAELRERITHADDKVIKRVYVVRRDPEDAVEWQTTMVRVFVRDWNVSDLDGKPIPITDADAIDRAPDDIIDTLTEPAVDLYKPSTEPDIAYAKVIGRMLLGQSISESEVMKLPDPELFKDALILSTDGRWSPRDLDETDALLLALVRKFRNAKRG